MNVGGWVPWRFGLIPDVSVGTGRGFRVGFLDAAGRVQERLSVFLLFIWCLGSRHFGLDTFWGDVLSPANVLIGTVLSAPTKKVSSQPGGVREPDAPFRWIHYSRASRTILQGKLSKQLLSKQETFESQTVGVKMDKVLLRSRCVKLKPKYLSELKRWTKPASSLYNELLPLKIRLLF